MKKNFLIVIIIVSICIIGCGSKVVEKENTNSLIKNSNERVREQSAVENEKNSLSFEEEAFVYNNPIDRDLLPIIYSEESSEAEIREAQDKYKELWIQEFDNLMKVLRKKCTYNEDKTNIDMFEKKIKSEIKVEIEVVTTELLDAYKVNPKPQKDNDISRLSLWGNGARSRLNQIEGEIYRDASMRIINIYGFISGEKYEFIEK